MLGLALWLFSCTEETLIYGPDIPEEGDHDGTGNIFSLAMRIPLPEDYAYTKADGENIGSMGEILIDAVRMVLYEGGAVKYSQDLDIRLEPDNENFKVTGDDVYLWVTDGNRIFIQTTTRTFERSTYDLLVLINPNAAIKEKTEIGQQFSDFNAIVDNPVMYRSRTVGEGANAYDEPVYFLMLNSQGLVNLKPTRFYETQERAVSNPSHINLERATAKVECDYTGGVDARSTAVTPYGRFVMLLDYNNQSAAPWGNDYDIPEDWEHLHCPVEGCGGTFNRKTKRCSVKPYLHTYDGLGLITDRVRYMVATDLTWEVDIVNKKSYWLRQMTYKAGGTALEKQGDTDRENFYAEDPNFYGLPSSTTLTDNFEYITNSNFDPEAEDYSAKKLYPQLSEYKYYNYWSWNGGDTRPIYIPENTMAQGEQKGDVVTRVVFRAILKREQFGESDTEQNPDSPASIGDFFVFKGGHSDIGNYTYNNYNNDNTTFYILRPEDVEIYSRAATTIDQIHIYLREGILEAIEQFKIDNPDFDFSDWKEEGPAISENLSFYKDGEIYYEVPIRHFSQAETGGYGHFGVVRNNWYKLNVENIISIGQPVLPAPTSEIIVRSAMPQTKSSLNSQIRNQSIIF